MWEWAKYENSAKLGGQLAVYPGAPNKSTVQNHLNIAFLMRILVFKR